MRNKKFIAIHRGGSLTIEQHRQLMQWACDCVKHALPLASEDIRLKMEAWMVVGAQWTVGMASVGKARKASLEAIGFARTLTDPLQLALVRAAGHAVATAHMADHSLRAIQYLLKAVQISGGSVEKEKQWQCNQLTDDMKEIIYPLLKSVV